VITDRLRESALSQLRNRLHHARARREHDRVAHLTRSIAALERTWR